MLTQGKPVLLNVWATWCPTCRAEHQYLNQLSAQGIRVVGMNYKDDRQKAISWLKELGNPYALSLFDGDGMLGLDLGVYGAPETFLIDGNGIIRYRHAGDLNLASGKKRSSRCGRNTVRRPHNEVLLGVLMLMISGSALATIDVLQFKDEAQEQQFRQLTEELRCPKCQNNSIADSNSMIATDLRQKVYELMQEGKSKKRLSIIWWRVAAASSLTIRR